MITICLVRHGETEWNALGRLQGRADLPLNITGVQQAGMLQILRRVSEGFRHNKPIETGKTNT
ncbi:phosphatase [Jeotgalibacillus soli]|uniref:Phosphatase n=1 Tax=Jeotgalibacillus soli TaxID=889306 RepID=A0A0C2R4P0_9BACL|nr:phosphatase [Jeotgalibacillus soli]